MREALAVMERYHISGVPITEDCGRLVGILTNRDLRFVDDVEQPVSGVMTSEDLITAPAGTTLEEAQSILHRHRVEKLPVVDERGYLTGLITVKDIQKKIQFPNATKDAQGRLARRRRGRRRRRRRGARGRAGRRGCRPAGRRYRARPLGLGAADGRADQAHATASR